jgi:hypothetical protein
MTRTVSRAINNSSFAGSHPGVTPYGSLLKSFITEPRCSMPGEAISACTLAAVTENAVRPGVHVQAGRQGRPETAASQKKSRRRLFMADDDVGALDVFHSCPFPYL